MAAAMGVAVEDVLGAFGANLERIQWRALLPIYGLPAGTLRSRILCGSMAVIRISRLAVRGAQRLVVLRAAPLFGWLGPGRGSVTT